MENCCQGKVHIELVLECERCGTKKGWHNRCYRRTILNQCHGRLLSCVLNKTAVVTLMPDCEKCGEPLKLGTQTLRAAHAACSRESPLEKLVISFVVRRELHASTTPLFQMSGGRGVPRLLETLARVVESMTVRPDLKIEDAFLTAQIPDSKMCVICLAKEPDIAYVPCGHVACCHQCSVRWLKNCPVCAANVDATLRLFFCG